MLSERRQVRALKPTLKAEHKTADAVAAPVTVLVSLVAARFTRCRVDALRWLVLFLLCSLADFLYFYVMPLCACALHQGPRGLESWACSAMRHAQRPHEVLHHFIRADLYSALRTWLWSMPMHNRGPWWLNPWF